MVRSAVVALAAVASTCNAFVLPSGASSIASVRRGLELQAGFGAATEKKKKTFVKPGKKDLEKQWENFFTFQQVGTRLFSCESVWARAGEASPWLRVGSVVTKADGASNAEAVAVQKPLITWTAAELHPTLQAAKAMEIGLGPYVDDDKDDAESEGTAAATKVAPVAKAKKGDTGAASVGFKPFRSPLTEHQTSLAGALLNKSVGKGSAKFKAAGGAPEGAADSKGVL